MQILIEGPVQQDIPFLLEKPLSDTERRMLLAAGRGVVVPALGDGEVAVAIVIVGRKSTGDPYTPEDRGLLAELAQQLAWIHEHRQLKERIADHERVNRQVLAQLGESRPELLRECPRCGRCYGGGIKACERDGVELVLTLPIERIVQGRYRLERVVGRGGMGLVFEAIDSTLDRRVAIKVLTGRLFGDPRALRRFEREARLLARLHHANIVAVHDYGVLETGGAFLVMELLEGESLDRIVERTNTIRPALLANWIDECCSGLAAAHAMHIIHRDLKPANIFVASVEPVGNVAKIVDFGLAKLRDEVDQNMSLTAEGQVLGTVAYMAPEQLLGEDPDARSDLYSLGVVAIEALTGRRPFTGREGAQVVRAVLKGDYRLPEPFASHVDLRRALERAIARSRWERFANAGEMRDQLVPAIRALTAR
jgi:hypothetical protein